MMWLGVDTAIVHAPYTGRTVEVDFVSKGHRSLRVRRPDGLIRADRSGVDRALGVAQ